MCVYGRNALLPYACLKATPYAYANIILWRQARDSRWHLLVEAVPEVYQRLYYSISV